MDSMTTLPDLEKKAHNLSCFLQRLYQENEQDTVLIQSAREYLQDTMEQIRLEHELHDTAQTLSKTLQTETQVFQGDLFIADPTRILGPQNAVIQKEALTGVGMKTALLGQLPAPASCYDFFDTMSGKRLGSVRSSCGYIMIGLVDEAIQYNRSLYREFNNRYAMTMIPDFDGEVRVECSKNKHYFSITGFGNQNFHSEKQFTL